ncbi:endonuclease [Corallococcus sp. CA047B]|uniref:putative Ig domain-containing protein n=1 Tax=Corallococcus sp. CA047B TaxID=2316729 RepID=UPI000EA1CC82|nr:putative Ig domain-containing protein [Corallococcus sp. CA047B]RKH16690.1 endonuclease [Corallococcus sp. CA047B]
MSLLRVLAPLLVLLLSACPGPGPTPAPPPDSGVPVDAGQTSDSGVPVDAGQTPALTISSATLAAAEALAPYEAALLASGGQAPYSWRVTLGPLVDGLTLSSEGVLTGTPRFSGGHAFTVEVQDAQGTRVEQTLTLRINGTAYALLPDAYVSEPYAWTFRAPDGAVAPVWSTGSTPPDGLRLDAGGTLSGVPTAPASAVLTVGVQDSGRAAAWTHALSVLPLPSITSTLLPDADAAQPYSATLTATGGKAPLVWSAAPGALPAGLTLSGAGVLSGTPSTEGAAFTVTVTDANARTASRELRLSFASSTLEMKSLSLADGRVGEPYSETLVASGGSKPHTWSFTGTLAAGLSLTPDGTLSGVPTAAGTVPFTATVRDAAGQTVSRRLPLTVLAPSKLFTVGHWNLEWFGAPNQGPPRSTSDGGLPDDLQVAGAREVLGSASAHVWGLVEMVDTTDFDTLKAGLPGYTGFLANNPAYVLSGTSLYSAGEQKPGILYDSSLTYRSAQIILTAQAADFGGRPPLRVDFTTRIHGEDAPLVVIVVHMKAFEDLTSYGQRLRSSAALKNYLDVWLPEARVLVIGDWNDDLDESIATDNGTALPTPFANFLDDPTHYTFITQPLTASNNRTTVEYDEVIDHTLATDEMTLEAVPGAVQVLRPDTSIPDYAGAVSDHFPVLSRYDFSGPAGPRVKLTAPLSGTFVKGETLTFTWRSAGVATVRIEVSYDDGEHWGVIAPSVSAAVGRHAWTVPDLENPTVRVRVVDTAKDSRFDMNPVALWFTRTAPRVFINEFLARPLGSTALEFIEVYNAGPASVDLSRWSLWDATSSRHIFAPGTTLAPGRALVVYGGATAFPSGTPDTVAASSGTLSLNNDRDTVQLRSLDGGVVDAYAYVNPADNVSDNRSPDLTPDVGFARHTTLPPGLASSPGRRADGGAFQLVP